MNARAGRPHVVPLFPLGSVLVPHLVLPLKVFEPRYRTLVTHLLDRDPEDREFGVVAIRRGREVGDDETPDFHEIGTTAIVQDVTALPDGRFELITVGHRRFRILGLDDSLPYLQAQVEFLDEYDGDVDGELMAAAAEAFIDYRSAFDSDAAEELRESLPPEPGVLSYLIASAMAVDSGTQQSLLEIPDAATRLRRERAMLRRERVLMEVLPSLPIFEPDRQPSLN